MQAREKTVDLRWSLVTVLYSKTQTLSLIAGVNWVRDAVKKKGEKKEKAVQLPFYSSFSAIY